MLKDYCSIKLFHFQHDTMSENAVGEAGVDKGQKIPSECESYTLTSAADLLKFVERLKNYTPEQLILHFLSVVTRRVVI